MQTVPKPYQDGPCISLGLNPMNSITLPTRANADVIEAMYRVWLDNPDGVDPTWRAFFQGCLLYTSRCV